MERPSSSLLRLSGIAALAATIGMSVGPGTSTARIFKEKRGKAPSGMRWRYSGVYIPGGSHCNVLPARIRNPKIAAHVAMMHEKWWAAKQVRASV